MFPNFCSISFAKILFSQRKCERKRKFSSNWICKIRSKFLQTSLKFSTFRSKSYFFCKNTIFLMGNGNILIFIERKLNETFAKSKIFVIMKSKIHWNLRKFWKKINKFSSFIFANSVQNFRWKPFLWTIKFY